MVEDYCNRPDHQDFKGFINSATDVEKAKATVSATLKSLNDKPYLEIKRSDYFWLERDLNRSVDDTINSSSSIFRITNIIRKTFCFPFFISIINRCYYLFCMPTKVGIIIGWRVRGSKRGFASAACIKRTVAFACHVAGQI